MEDNNELLKSLISKIDNLDKRVEGGFKSVNKRLDGIEHELRKIDTVLGYTEQYNNIPS